MNHRKSSLDVLEFGGPPRAGKGTIAEHLGNTYPNVTTDETGADYRALTKVLLLEGTIEHGMPAGTIQEQLARVSFSAFANMAGQRQAIIDEFGKTSLYAPDVAETVGLVSPIDTVRKAVKAGFIARVEAVRDEGRYDTLAVDGRNLRPVIESIPGTDLLARTYVSCTSEEATRRECDRLGIALDSDEGRAIFDTIVNRNASDMQRAIDPVRPDSDAIDYWQDPQLVTTSIENFAQADQKRSYSIVRLGAGTLAVTSGRQIHLDTTPFRAYVDPTTAMLGAIDTMYSEAKERTRVNT